MCSLIIINMNRLLEFQDPWYDDKTVNGYSYDFIA